MIPRHDAAAARRDVVVVGGGAAGIMAAIAASRGGARVTLLERKERIGKKILVTGNGRCNLSNRRMAAAHFHSESRNLFAEVVGQFDVDRTLGLFAELGLEVVELDAGRLYPLPLQASAVLNVLRHELDRLGVGVVCDEEVRAIDPAGPVVVSTAKNAYRCDRAILAAGGRSSPDLGSNGSGFALAERLGLALIPPCPSLVPLVSDYPRLKQLKGAKAEAAVRLVIDGREAARADGELLFTEYGLSGPPILAVSRPAAKALQTGRGRVAVVADLLPGLDHPALDRLLAERFERLGWKRLDDFFLGLLPKPWILPLLKDLDLPPDAPAGTVPPQMRGGIAAWVKGLTLGITGTRQWNLSQVTSGGVDCREVDPATLACLRHPRLHLCGELLDMDGDCGGYNLQWAWSSGYVAGRAASSGA